MLGKIARGLMLAALPLAFATAPVIADDDDHDRKRGKKHHHHKQDYNQVIGAPLVILHKQPVVFRHGPPPWAPAHGHRGKGDPGYVAPFGINIGQCYREQVGQVIGGVAGTALGSQIGQGTGMLVAVAGGTLLGVLVGGSVGRTLDHADYGCAAQILEHAPSNRTIIWSNPQSGATYQVTPTSAYQAAGRYCREYTTTAAVGGQTQHVYGTACRQPDGAWQIVAQ